MKKVSIITPCYNSQSFIEETYSTVLGQSFLDWEWILIDDCSTDKTYSQLLKLSRTDKRIKVFKNQVNSGAAVTRNVGLNNATGDFIAFLDSDDSWHPEKLYKQINHILKHDVDFSYHDYDTVDASGLKLKQMSLDETYTAKALLKYNPFATSSIIINRKIILENNIRFKEHLRRRQDYLFWCDSIAASPTVKGIPENLSSYRVGRPASLSSNKLAMAKIQWDLYRREFELGILKASWYTLHYAFHGLRKYL